MRLLLLSAFITVAIRGAAQDIPPIIKASLPKKGIYRDFYDFLNNAPSIHSPFRTETRSSANKLERGTADYRLLLLDSTTRKRDIKKFWGFSDGESVFINEVVYGGPLNFKRMHGIGRYSFFMGSVDNSGAVAFGGAMGGAIGGAIAGAAIATDGDYPYVLNINNGKVYLVNKKILRIILEDDPELLSLYEDEERKSKKNILLSYIKQYNERHDDEIKYSLRPIDSVKVTFYRKDRKERDEPVKLMIDDILQIRLEPNSLERVTWTNDTIDVCLGADCSTLIMDQNAVNYVECSWRTDEPAFEKVKSQEGAFYVRKIAAISQRKKKK